jgi:hypothetical protein
LTDSLIPTVAEEMPRARGADVFHAFIAGALGGFVAGLAGGVPYFLAHSDEALPWQKLAGAFFTYVMLAGAAYAASARAGVAVLDRIRGVRRVNALLGSIVGAAIVGPVPGAFGVAYFGSQPYVFMGTAMLALAPVSGIWITSASIATVDRRGAGASPSVLVMLAASFVATALFGGFGIAVFFNVDDHAMLEWFRTGARAAGIESGALLGAFVGAHIGTTLAIARAIKPRR